MLQLQPVTYPTLTRVVESQVFSCNRRGNTFLRKMSPDLSAVRSLSFEGYYVETGVTKLCVLRHFLHS